MDEAAHKIEAQIDRTRERLGSNLRELEHRIDAATDWREQFRARPHLFLGGALAGGALWQWPSARRLRGTPSTPPARTIFEPSHATALTAGSRRSTCGTASKVR